MTEPTALYSIRIPPRTPASGKPPLLILLHGIGANERDLAPLASHLDGRFDVRCVRAPISWGPNGFAWFEVSEGPNGDRRVNAADAESSRQKLLRFIPEAVTADGADPQRVYLAGFSQGGILALSVALTEPALIAGAVSMSGRILPEIEPFRAKPEALSGLPILVVHGTHDQRIPIVNGRAAEEQLSKLPVALTYREFPMGHEITRESLDIVSTWLTGQLDHPRQR